MIWVLCYDIEDDATRQKLARKLEKAGWERLQKSVFATGMEVKEFNRFYKKIKDGFETKLSEGDKIYAWYLSDAQFSNAAVMGLPYDAQWIQGSYQVFYIGEENLLK